VNDMELILVKYHSEIRSRVCCQPSAGFRVVLVDNASGADGVASVVRSRPNGRYVDSKVRQGLCRGRQSGHAWRHHTYGKPGQPAHLLI
jgi:hypothetical protein